MPFEGVPQAALRNQKEIESQPQGTVGEALPMVGLMSERREQMVAAIKARLAEVQQLPETAMSAGVIDQLSRLADGVTNLREQDSVVMERTLERYERQATMLGVDIPLESAAAVPSLAEISPETPSVQADPQVSRVLETVEVVEPKPEAVTSTTEMFDVTVPGALTEHVAAVARQKEEVLADLEVSLSNNRSSESVAKKRAAAYARIDFQKWQKIARELERAVTTGSSRRVELTSLLQRRYDSLAKNLNEIVPMSLSVCQYEIQTAVQTTNPAETDRRAEVLTDETVSVTEAPEEPLVLGAIDRVGNDEQLAAAVAKLGEYILDDSDTNLLRVCTENYHKFMDLGDAKRAGSYLHNIEEMLHRKERQKEAGVAHDEMKSNLDSVREGMTQLTSSSDEDLMTLQTFVDNVDRLLAEASKDPSREAVLQKMYQSLQEHYNQVTDKNKELSAAELASVPVQVTDSEKAVVSGAEALQQRKQRIFELLKHKLNTAAKAAVIAVSALYTSADAAGEYRDALQTAPVVSNSVVGLGQNAAWGGESRAVTTEDVVTPDQEKVIVMPALPEVMEASSNELAAVHDRGASHALESMPATVTSDSGERAATETLADTVEGAVSSPYEREIVFNDPATSLERLADEVLSPESGFAIPPVVDVQNKHRAREVFLHDAGMLKRAGVIMEGEHYFAGKVDLAELRQLYEKYSAETSQKLRTPHTVVVPEGGNLTTSALMSFESDLQVLSPSERQAVIESALAKYLGDDEDGALKSIFVADTAEGLDKDRAQAGAIIYLGGLAPYIESAIAEQTGGGGGSASESAEPSGALSSEDDASGGGGIDTVGKTGEVALTPENYPGGALGFSRDYHVYLESLGINNLKSSWVDSMFFSNAPSNRSILDMSVGEITKIMLGDTKTIEEELSARKIDVATAKSVYEVVRSMRVIGAIDPSLENEDTIDTVLQRDLLRRTLRGET